MQVADVLDITLQLCKSAFGAPLEVIPSAPLPAKARMQNPNAAVLWATDVAVKLVAALLLYVAVPANPTICEKKSGTLSEIVTE